MDANQVGTPWRVKLWYGTRQVMLIPKLALVVSSLFVPVFLIIVTAACSDATNDSSEAHPLVTAAPTPTLAPPSSSRPSPDPVATAAALPSTVTPVPEETVRLPQDEGAHLSGLEWWYFNGHLTTESGQEFSYHFVTFQSVLPSGLTPRLAQLSWADHLNGLHLTEEEVAVPLLEPGSGEFDLPIAGWRMSGNGELYHLKFGAGDYTVELEAVSQKPAVLHHGTGLVDLGVAGKTYYYSRTRLETSGTVSVSGVSHPVTGVSWMDHQWGDFTTRDIGWDWLSLNLDDGSDLMVSVVWERAGHKPISSYGTYISTDSAPVHLPGNDISLDSTGTWTSSVTEAVYPMNWKLRVDSLGLDLTLTPSMEEAEFDLSAFVPMVYWEGSVVAKGTRNGAPVAGRGFVEMVGYAPDAPEVQPTPSVQP